jgi:hypothetical protein
MLKGPGGGSIRDNIKAQYEALFQSCAIARGHQLRQSMVQDLVQGQSNTHALSRGHVEANALARALTAAVADVGE